MLRVAIAAFMLAASTLAAAPSPRLVSVEFFDLDPEEDLRVSASCYDPRSAAIWMLAEERMRDPDSERFTLHLVRMHPEEHTFESVRSWERDGGPSMFSGAVFCEQEDAAVSVATWHSESDSLLVGNFDAAGHGDFLALSPSRLQGYPVHVARSGRGFLVVSTTAITVVDQGGVVEQWQPRETATDKLMFGRAVVVSESLIAVVSGRYHLKDFDSAHLWLVDTDDNSVVAKTQVDMPYRLPAGLREYILVASRDGRVSIFSPPTTAGERLWKRQIFDFDDLSRHAVQAFEFVPYKSLMLMNDAVILDSSQLVLSGIEGRQIWVGVGSHSGVAGALMNFAGPDRHVAVKDLYLMVPGRSEVGTIYLAGTVYSVIVEENWSLKEMAFVAIVGLD